MILSIIDHKDVSPSSKQIRIYVSLTHMYLGVGLLYKAQADLGQQAEPKDKKLQYNKTVNDKAISDQGKVCRD